MKKDEEERRRKRRGRRRRRRRRRSGSYYLSLIRLCIPSFSVAMLSEMATTMIGKPTRKEKEKVKACLRIMNQIN